MKNIYFITGNKGKLQEVRAILPEVKQLNIDLPEIQEIDAKKVIEAKLLEALKHRKGQFIIEDTSLYLDCMNGLPGPLIKWFVKTIGNDGIYKIAKSFDNYEAEARTIIGFASSKNDLHFYDGKLKGKIVKPKGKKGFGWDPIFQPKGSTKSFSQMTEEEKNQISMRRIALNKLKKFL